MQYEYKSVVIEIPRKPGLWANKPDIDSVAEIENSLNRLGMDGWQMVGVFPVTDGGSPAQISRAIHHFMRRIEPKQSTSQPVPPEN